MTEPITLLAKTIGKRLRALGRKQPSLPVLKSLLSTAYHATLRTEEGRLLRGSITFSAPTQHPEDGPSIQRAYYPQLWRFDTNQPLSVDRLIKLCRAIDMWGGSIGVYGVEPDRLWIWGVIDQLVHRNVFFNREGTHGFGNPGIFEIVMDGVGSITAYYDAVLLAGLRVDRLLTNENDALRSVAVGNRIWPHLAPAAVAIHKALDIKLTPKEVGSRLYEAWLSALSRLCIGLRRLGTGGSILITPSLNTEHITIGNNFAYPRLGDSFILNVLDSLYELQTEDEVFEGLSAEKLSEYHRAVSDAGDRERELTGSVRIVTSLASIDGVAVLTPLLHVIGFGAKIGTGAPVGTVYDGADFASRGIKAKKIRPSQYGMRHNSILQYCRADANAVGVIVSQDGHVRVACTSGRSLLLWDDVKLLNYNRFSPDIVRQTKLNEYWRERSKQPSLGYTDTPKTLESLLGLLRQQE